ncbi:hypothetical protein ACFXPX_02835 [Kitasatospora sp. NPDC059146]|uniref:hypothetical protein n=1 Tax=Kitasatospora sp. NPDC059146 TaxID=3346741 RepID=UPI00368672A1
MHQDGQAWQQGQGEVGVGRAALQPLCDEGREFGGFGLAQAQPGFGEEGDFLQEVFAPAFLAELGPGGRREHPRTTEA